MFDSSSQPIPGITPRGSLAGPRGVSLLLSVFAWAVILLMVAVEMLIPVLVAAIVPEVQSRAQQSAAGPTNVEFELLARFHIGAKRFFDASRRSASAAPTGTAISDLRSKMRTAVDAVHLVPLAVELGDTTTAMSELDALLVDDALPVGLRRDARALEMIYRNGGPDKLDDAARKRFLSRHKWFADLALAHGKPESDPHRQAANGLATRTFAGMLVAVVTAGTLGLTSLGLCVGAIILLALGKMRSGYQARVPSSPSLFASLRLSPAGTPPLVPRDVAEFVAPAALLDDASRLVAPPVASQAMTPPAPQGSVAVEGTVTQIFDNAPTDVSVTVPISPVPSGATSMTDELFAEKPDDGQSSSQRRTTPEHTAKLPAAPPPEPAPAASAPTAEPAPSDSATPPVRRGPYVEAFAIYMVTFLGFSLVLSFCFPRATIHWIWFYLPVGVAVAAWPLLRGVSWTDYRNAIGLHRGRGIAVETLCGLGGYLAGVPLLIAGFIATFILVQAQQFIVDAWPSKHDVATVTTAPDAATVGDATPPTTTPDLPATAQEPVVTLDESAFAPPNAAPRRSAMPTHPIINDIKPGSGIFGFVGLFLLVAVWAPFSEELFFRGFLYHHLRGRFGWIMSAVIVGVVFAAVHPQGWTAIPVLGSIAFILAGVREWRGSLIGPIAAHAFNNGMLIGFMYLVLG